jgi:multiple sugar transport system permease protein
MPATRSTALASIAPAAPGAPAALPGPGAPGAPGAPTALAAPPTRGGGGPPGGIIARALENRDVLGVLFLLPGALLLLLFLSYPLGLGLYLGFTDAHIGRSGAWIGIENFVFLWGDEVTRLALFNTIFYTGVASVIKFVLGLWLAVLLNERLPFKALLRAVVLLPFIVPTALSAIAFWWIYDSQFSIISWSLTRLGLIDGYIEFLGAPWPARFSAIAANVWRGVPFIAISLLAGLQTIAPSYYEAASLDGATKWQQFRYVTLPLLTPIIAVVMTFSVLLTFTDFQLIYVLTRGGPLNATQLMATLSFQRAIPGGALGEGAAIAAAMVPFLLAAMMLSYFGLQRRGWQQGAKDR